MAQLSDEKRSLDDFKRWKVPELREFLRKRGLKTTGTKEELTALSFGAEQCSVPLKLTGKEEMIAKADQYKSLLNVNGEQLPDPFVDIKESEWLDEQTGMKKWPPIFQLQIAEFILTIEQGKDLGKRLLSDYKEGKAYSYFDSKWLGEVLYHDISPTHQLCFLKSESRPSQKIRNVPHKIWVCVNKTNGSVESAYCTCFAGLGSTCNHVAAVLFKVEHALKNGLTLEISPTSKQCVWNNYGKRRAVEPKRIMEMKWKKPHYSKKGRASQINTCSRQLFSTTPITHKEQKPACLDNLVNVFYNSSPDACVLWYADMTGTDVQKVEDDCNVSVTIEVETTQIPPTIQELSSEVTTVDKLMQRLPSLSIEEVQMLEEHTRGQSNNTSWKSHRTGRITASIIHRVNTKVHTLQRNQDSTTTVIPLVKQLISESSSENMYIPAIQYGKKMEDEACNAYIKELHRLNHKDIDVSSCGLFVSQKMFFIGASPDRLVHCSCCGLGLLEVKCPFSIANEIPTEVNLPYLHKNADKEIKLKHSHPYFSQVQTQMGVTGNAWCDFFVYTRHGFHLERITFDANLWQQLTEAAEYFFVNHIAPELLKIQK